MVIKIEKITNKIIKNKCFFSHLAEAFFSLAINYFPFLMSF